MADSGVHDAVFLVRGRDFPGQPDHELEFPGGGHDKHDFHPGGERRVEHEF